MNHYLNKELNEVYAYDDEQLKQVKRLDELEYILKSDMIHDNQEELEIEYNSIDAIYFTIRENVNNSTEITEKQVNEINQKKQEEHESTDEYKQQKIQQQEATKKQLLTEVKEEIEILQDTIDFDEHDEQDEAYLLELKKYRVQLNKVDTSIINCEFPQKPEK